MHGQRRGDRESKTQRKRGMLTSRWPNDSWQVSSVHRPLGSPGKIMGGGGGVQGRGEEMRQSRTKKEGKGECDWKRKMGRLAEGEEEPQEVTVGTKVGRLRKITEQELLIVCNSMETVHSEQSPAAGSEASRHSVMTSACSAVRSTLKYPHRY